MKKHLEIIHSTAIVCIKITWRVCFVTTHISEPNFQSFSFSRPGWGLRICFYFNKPQVMIIVQMQFCMLGWNNLQFHPPVQGKSQTFPLLCFSCVSPSFLHDYHTHKHFWHQICGGVVHKQAILWDTSWVFHNLTQFRHCLHGDHDRSHRERSQRTKTPPASRYQSQVKSTLSPFLLTNQL